MPKRNDDIIISQEDFGKVLYLKNDPKQREYLLVGITVRPGGGNILHLDYMGSEIEVFDIETSETRNELKYIEGKYHPDLDDEDD